MISAMAAPWRLLMLLLLLLPTSAALSPRSYEYVGPFPMGKAELDGDPLARYGGAVKLFAEHEAGLHEGKKKPKFISELAQGGYVGWSTLPAGSRGEVQVFPERVDWGSLVQGLDGRGVLEFQGWLFGHVDVARAGRYLASCQGVTQYFLDGTLYTGDVYRSGRGLWPCELEAGRHTFQMRARGAAGQVQVACRVQPAPAPPNSLVLQPPPFLPDVFEKTLFGGGAPLPLPILNTGIDWVTIDRVEFTGAAPPPGLVLSLQDPTTGALIAPGQLLMLPVILSHIDPTNPQPLACALRFSVRVGGASSTTGVGVMWSEPKALEFECRKRTDSFRFTFIGHDGSVGEAAAVAPWGEELEGASSSSSSVPIVLSLHGTGVPARNQADSFKFMPKKGHAGYTKKGRYRFGVENAWLCAPTRHGAHNWDTATGQQTAISAAEALATLSRHHRFAEQPGQQQGGGGGGVLPAADSGRVVYGGHSMGGHGGWILSTCEPDRALGVVVGAGWVSKQSYGRSNDLFNHDVSATYTEPALATLLEATVTESDVDQYVSNLAGLPVLIRVGSQDGTVPPYWSRKMARLLSNVPGVAVQYSELPGKEHWWWDTALENDGGVNNDPEVRAFLASAIGERGQGAQPSLPPSYELQFHNLASQPRARGVEVLQLHVPFQQAGRATVAWGCGGGAEQGQQRQRQQEPWVVRTSNIRRMRLYPLAGGWNASCIPHRRDDTAAIYVDGCGFSADEAATLLGGEAHLLQTQQTQTQASCAWRLVGEGSTTVSSALDAAAAAAAGRERWAADGGPARQVSEGGPFMLAVGTKANASAMLSAALFLANSHALGYNTYAPMRRDVELTSMVVQGKSMAAGSNLLVVGGPNTNHLAARWQATQASEAAAAKGAPSQGEGEEGVVLLQEDGSCSIDGRNYTGARTGVLMMLPHYDASPTPLASPGPRRQQPSGCSRLAASGVADCSGRAGNGEGSDDVVRRAMVLSATDSDGFADVMSLAVPTVPPMTRVPFANTVPDMLVTGPDFAWKGWGGLRVAAHLDSHWRVPSHNYLT